jgi:hypothetical protein
MRVRLGKASGSWLKISLAQVYTVCFTIKVLAHKSERIGIGISMGNIIVLYISVEKTYIRDIHAAGIAVPKKYSCR